MTIGLDTVNSSAYTGSGQSSNTAVINTTGTNRVVLAYVSASATSGTPTISSVSGGGLTWAKRSGQTFAGNGTHNAAMEIWWAWAAAQLSAEVITVTGGGAYDHLEISCLCYSGIPSSLSANPWDTNGSLPALFKYESNTNQSSHTTGNCPAISTDNASTCVIGMFFTNASPTNRADTPAGYTETVSKRNSGGTDWDHVVGENVVLASPVTNADVSFRDNVNRYGIIGDALTDTSPTTSEIASTLPGALTQDFEAVETNPGAITSTLSGTLTQDFEAVETLLATIAQTLHGTLIQSLSVHSTVAVVANPNTSRASQMAALVPRAGKGDIAPGAKVSDFVSLVAYAPKAARSARDSQMLGLVPYAIGASQQKIPRVSQFLHLVIWGSDIPSASRARAWAFVLDGHPMYVLDLGDEGTFIYDLATKEWSNFVTEGHVGWNMRNGTVWGDTNRIVGADAVFPYVWEMVPDLATDEGFRQIEHVVTGGITWRSRVFLSMAALRVAASAGQIQSSTDVVFNMRFSDDNARTWSVNYPLVLSPSDTTQDLAWRSLGSFMAPGRIIELSDKGGLLRIDGADVFIDNFDMDAPPAQPQGGGGGNGQ